MGKLGASPPILTSHFNMRFRTLSACRLLLLASVYVGCGTGSADTNDIIDAMEASFEDNLDGVETFTIYAAGMEVHHRLNTTDSLIFFDLGVTLADSSRPLPESARLIPYLVPDVPKLVRGLRTGARYVGTETLNGQPVYVIEADNPSSLIVGTDAPSGGISNARIYVDVETHALRGVTMEMPPPDTTLTEMIVQHVRYEQFRDVDGIALPFKVRSTTEGLRQLISDQLRIVEGGNLTIARAQAQRLPHGEREVELARIAARERFINEGIQEDILTVDSVHVNSEIPSGVFAESDAVTIGPEG